MRHDPAPDWRETTPADRIPIELVRPSPVAILLADPLAAVAGIAVGLVFVAIFLVIMIIGAR